MKRYYLLVVLLSLLPFVSILFTPLNPHTQDSLVHLARLGAFFKALKDGQFPIRWAGDLNYGYGMPLFDFIYQLPYYVGSFFLFLGFNLVTSFKLILVISFVFSGIFCLLFAKALFGDIKKALWVTIFYQFAPFRLVELLGRGDVGEVYTYTFLPLVCYGLSKLVKKPSIPFFILTSIATGLLIISHNSLSLTFFVVCVGFLLFLTQKPQEWVMPLSSLGMGILLSAYYWFPALSDHKYTFGDLFMKNLYLSHFVPIEYFLIPNFFNATQWQKGGVAVQFGLFQEIAILFGVLFLISRKISGFYKKIFLFGLVLITIAVFFMEPTSKFVWAHVALLRQFQFPWRFLGVVVFATSLLSVSMLLFSFIAKKWIYLLILSLTVFSTAWYWRPPFGYDKVNETYYWNYPLTSTYYGETDVIWSPGQATKYPTRPVDFAAGKGSVSNYYKISTQHRFIVNADVASTIVDHTEYFPGWKVVVNGKDVPIEFQDQNYRGQITFHVPAGKDSILVQFGETKTRLLADMVTLGSVVALIVLGVFYGFRTVKKKL